MKKIILSVILLLLSTTSLAAMTVVETTAKHDILYNHPVSIGTSMGKLAATDEYGVFLNIVCRAEEGESEQVSFFYRLNSGAVVEGKSLFTEIEGEKIILIDGLSTLLIYNNENEVVAFVKDIVSLVMDDVGVVAFAPETKEKLLTKIFDFFDEVVKK